MKPSGQAGKGRSARRGWLAGRTLRPRLIAGLLALFTVASVGVGIATTFGLSHYLMRQLDEQVLRAGDVLSRSLEHPLPGSPGTGADAANSCQASLYSPIAQAQALRTFAARLANGRLSYACIVTGGRATGGSGHGPDYRC